MPDAAASRSTRPTSPPVFSRRTLVGTAAALPACGGLRSAGGLFAAGSDRIGVGLVGCGGRGTGAALQAAAADRGVSITCLADPFADHVASSARVLAAGAGRQFACPPDRRFVGMDAWHDVVAADVDLVILATPPAFRPLQAAAAVRAGKHVYCEKPAAIDAAGVGVVLAACAEARRRGLAFGSGLSRRHDAVVAEAVARIRGGSVGAPRHATVHHRLGLPWQRPPHVAWTPAERRLRNWISAADYSGGDMVEHLVDAVDLAVWALGDDEPFAAVPAPTVTASAAATRATIVFADGRTIDAAVARGSHRRSRIVEEVRGTAGVRDLGPRAPVGHGGGPHQAAMAAVLASIRGGRPVDEGRGLCRSTLVAIMGRMAAETGTAVSWSDLQAAAIGTA